MNCDFTPISAPRVRAIGLVGDMPVVNSPPCDSGTKGSASVAKMPRASLLWKP